MNLNRWGVGRRLGVVMLLVFTLLLAACDTSSGGQSATVRDGTDGFPLTLTDASGRTQTFDAPPQRIISYSPGATETLFAVGAGPRVVAVDKFSDYPPQVTSLPKLDYLRPSPEPALALRPDLVIMSGAQRSQVETFRGAGLTVLFLAEPPDIAGVIDNVRLLGRLTGNASQAERLAQEMQRRVAAVQEKASRIARGPSVFYELTPDLYTVAPQSFIGSMLTLVKATNIAAGATSAFPQLSQEVVLRANPDVILLADSGDSGGQSLATVRERPGWSALRAVQSGHVYEVDADLFSRPGPRIVDALEQLFKLLYPEL